jgi:glycosyltransferase involved in cell wall biosynthesis
MKKVLLINQGETPHYRVPVYNYLSAYLEKRDYSLIVTSERTQKGNTHRIEFDQREVSQNFLELTRLVLKLDPDIIIYWVNLKYLFLFPMLIFTKLLRKKIVYWGHGTDLSGKGAMKLKSLAYSLEFKMSDALILYAEHLKLNVKDHFYPKTFIANNTLNFNNYQSQPSLGHACLAKYNITTKKNIICMGRMQKRKRLDHLFNAFDLLNRKDVGLILVGPDNDGILSDISGENIFKIPPVYGDERLDLLSAADIFCIPGAIGLSIVDAFYCGLPIVTEAGDASPEIMYLKDGINGFVVPRGDIQQLTEKLLLLLDDNALRTEFSQAAEKEISTNGHMDIMCKGFNDALQFVCRK